MKRATLAWIALALILAGLSSAASGWRQLHDFMQTPAYEGIFAGSGFGYGINEEEGEERALRERREWAELVGKTLAVYWFYINLGLAISISSVLTAGFYCCRYYLFDRRYGYASASGMIALSAFTVMGSLLFTGGVLAEAIITTIFRGLTPWWADSLAIPIYVAVMGAVPGMIIFLMMLALLAWAGTRSAKLFPGRGPGARLPRKMFEEFIGFPFFFFALVAAGSTPELAPVTPLFLHVGLTLRARAIVAGNARRAARPEGAAQG